MSEIKATMIVQCWGCGKSQNYPLDPYCIFDARIDQLISKEGWIRRKFGPNATPWFCGVQCAYHSQAALQCEEWWRKNPPPHWFKALLKRLIRW